jgi:hypothetical protein
MAEILLTGGSRTALSRQQTLRAAILRPAPARHDHHDRSLAAVRVTLGEEAFRAAWAEGQALPLEQAVKCALENSSDG